MSRKLTGPNPHHPHTLLVHFRQKLRKHYACMPNDDLGAAYKAEMNAIGQDPTTEIRHERIEDLVRFGEIRFKEKWKQVNGWAFDDCYDPVKLKANLAATVVKTTAAPPNTVNTPAIVLA